MSDETKPNEAGETKLEDPGNTNPDTGREAGSEQPSAADSSEPSQEAKTLEQYQQELQAEREKIDNLTRGMNDAQREAAEFRKENEQYRGALQQFVSREQAAQDPVLAAEQRFIEAQNSYDPEATAQAQLELMRAYAGRAEQNSVAKAVQMAKLMGEAERVQGRYGFDANTLAQFQQQMTPEDIAIAKLHREGRLDEFLGEQRKAKEAEAARAAAIGQLVGTGSPGTVPGGGDDAAQKTVDDISFLLRPKAEQKQMLKDGFRVYSNSTGEDVTPEP